MAFVSTFDHTNPMADYLAEREQLMHDIECIVDATFMEMFGWEDVDKWSNHKDKLTSMLCDAVCKNFPTN